MSLGELQTVLQAAWQATSNWEVISVIFGLAYLILAARESIWCWPCAFISTATAIVLFWKSSLPMESALNVFYLVMAIYGFWQWQNGDKNSTEKSERDIVSWSWQQHALAFTAIAMLTILFGKSLPYFINSAHPFVDSFTTWAAVITTFMVAHKVLENWLYWLVIDSVAIWLYLQRDLYLYALLFFIYLFIVAAGYMNWRKLMLEKQNGYHTSTV